MVQVHWVRWSTSYTPYGLTYNACKAAIAYPTGALAVDDPSLIGNCAFDFNLRAPGQYFDAETGFYYNGQRYYVPLMRRYNRPEPIGQAGSLDLYMYAGGNPVMMIDPTGLAHYLITHSDNDEDTIEMAKYRKKQIEASGEDTADVVYVPSVDALKHTILKQDTIDGGWIHYGHANPYQLAFGTERLSVSQVQDFADATRHKIDLGAFIELNACNSGVDISPKINIAQAFADAFQVKVLGWTSFIGYAKVCKMINGKRQCLPDARITVPLDGGKSIWFSPIEIPLSDEPEEAYTPSIHY